MDHITIADYVLFLFTLVVFVANTLFMRDQTNSTLLVTVRPYPFSRKIVIEAIKVVFIMGAAYTALIVYLFTRIMQFFSVYGGVNTSSYIVAILTCMFFLSSYIQSLFISTLKKLFIRETNND